MDLSILNCLIKAPKKKYIKKLVDYCVSINNRQNCINQLYKTPVSQTFSNDLQLSQQETHHLIKSLLLLINFIILHHFQADKISQYLEEVLDSQIKQLLIQVICSMESQIIQSQQKKIKNGDELSNLTWKLQSQIANQRGKSTSSIVQIQMTIKKQKVIQQLKFQMKGQQFQVFFSNLTKIKQTLTELIKQ